MHIMWCYLFVNIYGWDLRGVSLATTITYLTLAISINVYAGTLVDIREAYFLPNKETFKDIIPYLKLAIPGCLLLSAEWWMFEILTLISGYLHVDYTATYIILSSLGAQIFTVALGL